MKIKFLCSFVIVMMILAEGVFANAQAPGPGPRRAGGFNGGGGYSALCNDGKHYALDYVAYLGATGMEVEPRLNHAPSTRAVLEELYKQIDEKLYEVSLDFKDFIELNEDLIVATRPRGEGVRANRMWVNGPMLRAQGDQQALRVPESCIDSQNQLKLQQVAVRFEPSPGTVFYEYKKERIEELERTSPVQASYAYVHEWLREFTEDPVILMRANTFLHSQTFFQMNKHQAVQYLRMLGLNGLGQVGLSNVSIARDLKPKQYLVPSWNGSWKSDQLTASNRRFILVGRVCHGYVGSSDRDNLLCESLFESNEFSPNSSGSAVQSLLGATPHANDSLARSRDERYFSKVISGEFILEKLDKWKKAQRWAPKLPVTFLFQLMEVSSSGPSQERARGLMALEVLSQGAIWKTDSQSSYREINPGPFHTSVTLSSRSCRSLRSCSEAGTTELALDFSVYPVERAQRPGPGVCMN